MQRLVLAFTLTCLLLVVGAMRNDLYQERMNVGNDLIARLASTAKDRTHTFSATAQDLTAGNANEARQAFLEARRAYKSAEPFLEYLDNFTVWMKVNGAPLPKTDKKSTFLDILEPEGFQIIEEKLFADGAAEQAADIARLARNLDDAMSSLHRFATHTRFHDRNFIESARTSLLRIATLSITGFDNPASGASMDETWYELQTVKQIAELYYPELVDKGILKGAFESHIKAGENALRINDQPADFDTFDRLEFIRTCVDPLFKDFVDLQTILGVEFVNEVSPRPVSVNPRAQHIFDTDLFDVRYYTRQPADADNTELVALGRLLFFDPILSENGERACASCHDPSLAFTDGFKTSVALDHDGFIDRNAPTLVNSIFAERYFYDLRATRIEEVIQHVVSHPREFGSNTFNMVSRLEGSSEYRQLFEQAFKIRHPQVVNITNAGHAIAAYIASLSSYNTITDRYSRGEQVQVDRSVRRGFNIFMGKGACATCHFPPTYAGLVPPIFHESESEIIGVPVKADTAAATLDPDIGRYGKQIKEVAPFHKFSFKTMTVRNAGLTAPYMHNGAYATLEQVVDFYNRGGGKGIGIDLEHQTLPFDRLDLTDQEQKDLVAFMRSLTDTTNMNAIPSHLPKLDDPKANDRVVGGNY